MSTKKLIILLAVFILAAGLVGISKLLEKESGSIVKESGYQDIAPEGFLKADVAWFEIWRGDKTEKKVTVNRTGESWTVGSRFGAPADSEKVDTFLGLYKGLMGTVRSRSKDLLEDYGLKDDQAVHVRIVMKGEKEEPCEILIGSDSKFVRKKGENTVFSVDKDFHDPVGIYSESDAPKSTAWLKKQILSIEKDDVTRMVLAYPDKEFVLEKKEKKDESGEKKEEKDKDGLKPDKKKEYEWKIVSGGPEWLTPKDNPAKKVLDKLNDLECNDAVDPEKKEEWGLKDPAFRLTVTKDDDSTVEILGGLPKTGSKGYVTLSSSSNVYELSNWVFTSLFPSGDVLFEGFPERVAKKDEITQVKVTNFKGRSFTVACGDKKEKKAGEEKKDDEKEYVLESPDISLEVKKSELEAIITGIDELKAEDFATLSPDSELIGLGKPSASAEITLKDGTKKVLTVGNRSRTTNGFYMSFGDGRVYAGVKYKVEKIFPELKELFKKDLADIDPDTVESAAIRSSTETIELERTDKGWKGKEGGTEYTADEKPVKDYLGYFNPLSIDDITEKEAEGKPTEVELTLKKGEKKKFTLRKGKDTYTVVLQGTRGVFTIDKMTYERVAALFMKFKKEKPKETKKEEAKEDTKEKEQKENKE